MSWKPHFGKKTLFERLGGRVGISTPVEDTVDAQIKNQAMNIRFLLYLQDSERLVKIKRFTIYFLVPVAVVLPHIPERI